MRLIGTTVGNYGGNITHTSAGATQVDLPVSGEVQTPAGPTIFLVENFNYTAGELLTANGWENHSGTTNYIQVTEPGLIYTGYPPALGLGAALQTSGEDVNRGFTPQNLGNLYASFLVNVTSAKTTGDYFFHFSTSPINTQYFRGKVFIQKDSETNNFRFGLTNGASDIEPTVTTGYDYVYGTTYLVVLKYEIVPGSNNDLVHLWVNPTISDTESTPLLTSTDAITS